MSGKYPICNSDSCFYPNSGLSIFGPSSKFDNDIPNNLTLSFPASVLSNSAMTYFIISAAEFMGSGTVALRVTLLKSKYLCTNCSNIDNYKV